MKIEGAVALVTGGARGLGLAIASHLADLGAVVVAADRDATALASLPATIAGVETDVTDPARVAKTVADIASLHGGIDVLVNNAGVIFSAPLVNMLNPKSMMHDYGQFRDCVTANLDSVFIATSAVVEHMVRARRPGVIVNISSISARGNAGQTAYSAAKAGVNAMTVTWSKELGRLGIRCNAIAPGFIDTEATRRALSSATVKHLETSTPAGRLGSAKDVAEAAAYLIQNDFVTGAILDVNGGLVI